MDTVSLGAANKGEKPADTMRQARTKRVFAGRDTTGI
jgi:hypothetical protein